MGLAILPTPPPHRLLKLQKTMNVCSADMPSLQTPIACMGGGAEHPCYRPSVLSVFLNDSPHPRLSAMCHALLFKLWRCPESDVLVFGFLQLVSYMHKQELRNPGPGKTCNRILPACLWRPR